MDVDDLVELDSDLDVMRFINGGKPTPRDEIELDLLPGFLGYYERYAGYGFWAAIEKANGHFVGWFHFRPLKGGPPDVAELGYRFRKSAWGKGYATEGSRALVRKGFIDHGVQRVVAFALFANTASRRVMEKAGLKLVRTFESTWPVRIEGDELGSVEYALTWSDWEVQQSQSAGGGPEDDSSRCSAAATASSRVHACPTAQAASAAASPRV